MSEIRNLTRNGETFYPLCSSEGLVNRDGNVVGEINDIFDISEYNSNTSTTPPTLATYASLDLALAAIPTTKRKGGMTIRYVQSSDNEYVQYRLMSETFNTTVVNWQGVDGELVAGSRNLVESGAVFKVDKKIEALIKNDPDNTDLDISDEDGYVISRFVGGHVKTKNFDSSKAVSVDEFEEAASKTPKISDSIPEADLDVKDENGNVVMILQNGHVKTKNFDSSKISFPKNRTLSNGVLGFNRCPNIWSEDYDYLLVFVYGQSYTIATDGRYKLTNDLDDNIYCLGNHFYVQDGNSLVKLKNTSEANQEYCPDTAMDIIAKLCRMYSFKTPKFIIGNVGRGSRTCLELMKESSIQSLLTPAEWETFYNLSTYDKKDPDEGLDVTDGWYRKVTAYLDNLNRWATENNKKILCPFIIYLQGESDTHSQLADHGSISCSDGNYSVYKERLNVMLSDLRSDIMAATGQTDEPAVFLDNIGNSIFKDTLSGISQVQTDLPREVDGVYTCGPYYAYPSYGPHPTPDGRRWIAECIGRLFYKVFLGCERSDMYVDSYKIDGNSVILDVVSPTPPLVIDNYTSENQPNCGFKAFDGNMTEIAIDSVSVSCSSVIINFGSLPVSDFYISYGSSGYGNIRDSERWNSKYKYTSNALGDEAQIAHYPKDKDGNAIIGEYYPMWNWLPFGFVYIEL